MLKKIYKELVAIKIELQAIRESLEPQKNDIDAIASKIQERLQKSVL